MRSASVAQYDGSDVEDTSVAAVAVAAATATAVAVHDSTTTTTFSSSARSVAEGEDHMDMEEQAGTIEMSAMPHGRVLV